MRRSRRASSLGRRRRVRATSRHTSRRFVMVDMSGATTPVGVGFTPFENRLDVIDSIALHAERRELAFVSVAEAMSLSAPIVLARLAERTERIGLSTGVLSVWSRTPATLAL